ncbi:hypothetical protein NADFUDRAFT_80859 [Nadsonia fulvescens var. elongata DSM 6958]|uniref:Dynactin subunit 4 n=1 Tax=Nadsonia fulvescens var. elongata DSM 6958 TaxID=857566 RepID=A0A1E3PCY9_9ASCO|nr:hypothetical protein NADFUDRAFT_80859 [Nadsonia fulvescens var. elongata DSM 6958]
MYVYCPCQDPNDYSNHYPVEYLYLCPSSHDPSQDLSTDSSHLSSPSLKCPLCIATTVMARYCPQCQFSVTTSEAIRGKMRCLRGCFQCPDCGSTVKSERGRLACTYCTYTWESKLDLGDKASTAQLIKELTEFETRRRFDKVKSFVKNGPDSEVTINPKKETIPISNSLPIRTLLAARESKRCNECQTPLSITSRNNSILHSATHYLPRLIWSKRNTDSPNSHNYTLLVINTQPIALKVTLATDTASPDFWVIINPSLSLAAHPGKNNDITLLSPMGTRAMRRQTGAYTRFIMNAPKVVVADDTGVSVRDNNHSNAFWGEMVVNFNTTQHNPGKLPLLVTCQGDKLNMAFWILVNV